MATNVSSNGSLATTPDYRQSRFEIMSSPHWYLSMTICIMVMVANGWIAVSFIHYAIVKKVFAKRRSRTDVNGGMVMALALVAITLPFVRYFGTIFLLVMSLYPEHSWGCEAANDILVVGFACAVFPTYAYLWARQRAFYGHPSLGGMYGKFVSCFSKMSLVLIMLSASVSVGMGIHPTEYHHRPGGCFLIGGEEQNDYRTYIYAIVMILSQVSLLGLFLHPLFVHARHQESMETNVEDKAELSRLSVEAISSSGEDDSCYPEDPRNKKGYEVPNPVYGRSISMPTGKSRSRCVSESSDRKRKISEPPMGDRKKNVSVSLDQIANKVVTTFRSGVRRSSKNRRIFLLIRRVLYLALISIFSDFTVMMINQFMVPDDIPQTYSFVMYDVNILINVLTVILSFVKWRVMLTSPCNPPK